MFSAHETKCTQNYTDVSILTTLKSIMKYLLIRNVFLASENVTFCCEIEQQHLDNHKDYFCLYFTIFWFQFFYGCKVTFHDTLSFQVKMSKKMPFMVNLSIFFCQYVFKIYHFLTAKLLWDTLVYNLS